MCTLQYYFGKLEMATVVFKTGQKHLHHIRTPKKATFVSSEQMQVCFKSPKTKSDKISGIVLRFLKNLMLQSAL